MSLALPTTCVLFILLMQSVNGAKFFYFNLLLILFAASSAAEVSAIDIVSLKSIYASL